MQYTISTDGVPYTADTSEGALSKAALLIWFPHGKIADYRQALKRGEELTIVYGFKSVTITPVQGA